MSLPGIGKINAFDFTVNSGIDNDILILHQFEAYEKQLKQKKGYHPDLFEIEKHLNQKERIISLFPNPVPSFDDEEKISPENIEQIQIPDAQFFYHTDLQNQHLQNGPYQSSTNYSVDSFRNQQNQDQQQNQTQSQTQNYPPDQIPKFTVY